MATLLFDTSVWTSPWFQDLGDHFGWDANLVAACILTTERTYGGRCAVVTSEIAQRTGLDLSFVETVIPSITPHLQTLKPHWPSDIIVARTRGDLPALPGRPSHGDWARLRAYVFERDGYTCQYCGDTCGPLECDHILPVSRGGDSDPSNLTTACRSCNCAKRDKTPEEWLR